MSDRQKATKVKCKRDESTTIQSIFEECIYFFRRSIWVLLELVRGRTQNFTIIDWGNIKQNKFTFGTPKLPDLLCKHWFTSSVWNFSGQGADIPSAEERGKTAVFAGWTGQPLFSSPLHGWRRGSADYYDKPFYGMVYWNIQRVTIDKELFASCCEVYYFPCFLSETLVFILMGILQ